MVVKLLAWFQRKTKKNKDLLLSSSNQQIEKVVYVWNDSSHKQSYGSYLQSNDAQQDLVYSDYLAWGYTGITTKI